MVPLPDNRLVIGGNFSQVGNVVSTRTAIWSDGGWTGMVPGSAFHVQALAPLTGGEIIVVGNFNSPIGGDTALARWDGEKLVPFIGPASFQSPIAPMSDGAFLLASRSGTTARVHRMQGAAWAQLGPTFEGTISTLEELPDGRVIAGGNFSSVGGNVANSIAAWNGTDWQALGDGLNGQVRDVTQVGNGDLVAVGDFTASGQTPLNRIARWDGVAWSDVGGGLNASVRSISSLQDGGLVVGGDFTSAGGAPANRIARWDGESWSVLGEGFDNSVYAVAQLSDGRIVAGGTFTTSGSTVTPYFAIFASPSPVIVGQIHDALTCAQGAASYSIRAIGIDPAQIGFRWQCQFNPEGDWVDLNEGFNASADDPSVTFAASGAADDTLSLLAFEGPGSLSLRWKVRCIVSNSCGETRSNAVRFATCRADFDCSGTIHIADVFAFLSAWFAQDAAADFDGDGHRGVPDIHAFLSAWFQGCG